MSADNWTICPKCKQKAERDQNHKRRKAADSYGKVSAERFTELCREAEQPIELEEHMREDYELGVDEDGEFYVIYSCSCEDCGFEFKYRHREQAMYGSGNE